MYKPFTFLLIPVLASGLATGTAIPATDTAAAVPTPAAIGFAKSCGLNEEDIANLDKLEKIGGLEKYRNYIAEDIAIGEKAYKENISIMLGPLIESPVGEMSFSNLLDKFSRAALYAITMRGLRNNWMFIFIYSYFLLLFPPGVFLYSEIVILYCFIFFSSVEELMICSTQKTQK